MREILRNEMAASAKGRKKINDNFEDLENRQLEISQQQASIKELIDSGELGGSLTIDGNYFFDDNTARDMYFTAHASEKVDITN